MQNHQASQKKSSTTANPSKSSPFFSPTGNSPESRPFFVPTGNSPESRPFVVQPKAEATTQPPQTQEDESQITDSAILNFEGERSPVQAKLAIQRQEEQPEILQAKTENTSLQRQEESKTPNQTGLPDNLKAGVENLSGYSLDDVRVHYNSPKPAQLQALAYTQGTDIHVAPGQEQHLPHEAWHVVQQMQGRVKPTMQMKGEQINDDERLETEADVMRGKALQIVEGKSTETQRFETDGDRKEQNQKLSTTVLPIQLLSYILYNPVHNRPDTDVVLGMNHVRVPHNDTQRKLAAYYSGYDITDVTGWICNHHVPYAMIQDAVCVAMQPPASATLANVVHWMSNLPLKGAEAVTVKSTLYPQQYTFDLGKQPQPKFTPVPQGASTTYAETELNKQVDDLIFNLANDPRNLFYWPSNTGDNGGKSIDNPTGKGGTDLKWQQQRLKKYYNYLQGLGLNI